MKSKSDLIKDKLCSGDSLGAIAIASRFFDRGADTHLYKQAQSAVNNPGFYRQIGKDPDAIIAAAVASLHVRFD